MSEATPRAGERTVLLVDDDTSLLALERAVLERHGHRIVTASSGADALAVFEREPVHVVVADYCMPVMTGEELIQRIRRHDPLVQAILQTGYVERNPPRDIVRRLDIHAYHDKADGPERLVHVVEAALKAYTRIAELHLTARLKTELLAHVSHEFRTPLGVIVGYLDLIGEGDFGPLSPQLSPVLGRVRGNASHLLDLVEEFLDLARLETTDARDRRQPIPLTAFLRELGESFALVVRGRPVEFRTALPEHLPAVMADPAQLRIVVQNLLGNAVKFTESGYVRLAAEPRVGNHVAIVVHDTGPGIALEQQEAIFDLFRQVGPASQAKRGSLGLGLALARRFARVMGGDVTVQSRPGAGATFTVVLPAVATAPPQTEVAA